MLAEAMSLWYNRSNRPHYRRLARPSVRPSVRPSACSVQASNSKTKRRRKRKIGVNIWQGGSNRCRHWSDIYRFLVVMLMIVLSCRLSRSDRRRCNVNARSSMRHHPHHRLSVSCQAPIHALVYLSVLRFSKILL